MGLCAALKSRFGDKLTQPMLQTLAMGRHVTGFGYRKCRTRAASASHISNALSLICVIENLEDMTLST
jgi:hypothetical protein